ncbi:tyrosine-type recombinase/integrase [Adonisia turfae]|uniref:tyrosine-type recombinase/integrase n=1 Tax=Adonisia turfae TaxID=2950184 RepID=UPI0032B42110
MALMLEKSGLPVTGYLFPGKRRGCITRQAADYALRKACDRLGFEGYSTHSFRRTALTRLSNAGIPLRVIQEISGHKSLTELQKYLAVSPEQVEDAISNI